MPTTERLSRNTTLARPARRPSTRFASDGVIASYLHQISRHGERTSRSIAAGAAALQPRADASAGDATCQPA